MFPRLICNLIPFNWNFDIIIRHRKSIHLSKPPLFPEPREALANGHVCRVSRVTIASASLRVPLRSVRCSFPMAGFPFCLSSPDRIASRLYRSRGEGYERRVPAASFLPSAVFLHASTMPDTLDSLACPSTRLWPRYRAHQREREKTPTWILGCHVDGSFARQRFRRESQNL